MSVRKYQNLLLRGAFCRSLFFRLAITPFGITGDGFVVKSAPRNDSLVAFSDRHYLIEMAANFWSVPNNIEAKQKNKKARKRFLHLRAFFLYIGDNFLSPLFTHRFFVSYFSNIPDNRVPPLLMKRLRVPFDYYPDVLLIH